jgi:hypothetical protein
MRLSPRVEEYRLQDGNYRSPKHATFGAFQMPGPCGERLTIIASDGLDSGWEHVSVSTGRRVPNWREMCFVKSLFWGDDEWVVQFHPAASDYVNNCSRCLHLWKYRGHFPTPAAWMVGYKELGVLS